VQRCLSFDTHAFAYATYTSQRKSGERDARVIIGLAPSQYSLSFSLSLSLRASDDVFFTDTLSRTTPPDRITAPRYHSSNFGSEFPQCRSFLARTYGRIYAYFWKICQKLRKEIRGFCDTPLRSRPCSTSIHLSLTLTCVSDCYNPRIIQFPSRRHAHKHQLQIITAVLFK